MKELLKEGYELRKQAINNEYHWTCNSYKKFKNQVVCFVKRARKYLSDDWLEKVYTRPLAWRVIDVVPELEKIYLTR